MTKNFAIAFGIGIGLVAIVLGVTLYVKRGSRVGLEGQILKVRTASVEDNAAIAVLDFRIHNPSDVRFAVRTVTAVLEDRSGKQTEGQSIGETDAKRMFDLLPILGQKFSTTLVMNDSVHSHTSQDRMLAVRLELPESALESRKRFLIRIEEVDGQVSEISEK